jgi:CheY-like chemotaxis protein
MVKDAFQQHKIDHVEGPLQALSGLVKPLKQWATDLHQASTPFLQSMRAIGALAGRVKRTVMVVDDQRYQFEFISKMLKDEPYHLVFASSGAEAMRILRQTQPDILLMDYQMPDMDGMQVMRWMRSSSHFSVIPIIMITSNSEESIVENSLKAGATDFMVKPLNREALIQKVAKVLQDHAPLT